MSPIRVLLAVLPLVAACSSGGHAVADAGPPDAGPAPTVCPAAGRPPPPSGVCTVTPGSAAKLITADILTSTGVFQGGQVLVDETGKIACVGCDCSAMASGAALIDCPQGVASPGLINTHDHITYQSSPVADTGERYEQRNDWRKGLRGHTQISPPGNATMAQLQIGELRFIMGGATSTVGSGGTAGLLRNLDKAEPLQEGAGQTPVKYDTFPLGDSSGTQLASGCGYPAIEPDSLPLSVDAYFPHVAEGIDDVAHNEFVCESSDNDGAHDLTQPESAFIHSVGLGIVDYDLMANEKVSLIWSPRSNTRLYGNTAVVPLAARLGVRISLGTDWLPSGSMNLLRELKCADSWNSNYFAHAFTDAQLWRMVTVDAAGAAAFSSVIGDLAPGLFGDVSIFDGSAHKLHRAVIDAEPADVVLVMRAGKPLYGDASIVGALQQGCDALDVCGVMKQACVMSEVNQSLSSVMSAAPAGNYPLFVCGAPMDEPTCTPMRMTSVDGSTTYGGTAAAGDMDGDGIPDAMDNCPSVFNPIRPLDHGMQPDIDQDGIGDVCDPCPLLHGTTGC